MKESVQARQYNEGCILVIRNQTQTSSKDQADMVQKLSEFGLSFDEASIFYVLTRIKKSGMDWITGKDLARIAKRDRVRVYQVLQKLEVLGLIRANFDRPTGYCAMPADVAIQRLLSIHEAKLSQLNAFQSQLEEALRKVEPIGVVSQHRGDDAQNEPAISMFHGVSGIQHLIREAVKGNSLRIIANPESIEYILSTIESIREKPKSCKIIVSGNCSIAQDQLIQERTSLGVNFESSYIQGHLPTFILTDSLVLILFYSLEEYKPRPLSQPRSRLVMLHALAVSDKIYQEEMHQLFERLWQSSVQSSSESISAHKDQRQETSHL